MRGHGVEVIGATQLWPWLLRTVLRTNTKDDGSERVKRIRV